MPMMSYQRSTGTRPRDQERAGIVAILHDLQEVARLLGQQRLGAPVVENEQVGPGELAQELAVAPVAAGQRQRRKQARHAVVQDREVLPASLVPKRAREPTFADPARPGNQEVAPGPDPAAAAFFATLRS